MFIKVKRGVGAYIVEGSHDEDDKILIYTILGKLVEINPKEIMFVGFD
tara:strand:- start:84 stop:227 length:144 start_codon:yes stop_codon:yes gene_type:complete